jgi:hypothetical protein
MIAATRESARIAEGKNDGCRLQLPATKALGSIFSEAAADNPSRAGGK